MLNKPEWFFKWPSVVGTLPPSLAPEYSNGSKGLKQWHAPGHLGITQPQKTPMCLLVGDGILS